MIPSDQMPGLASYTLQLHRTITSPGIDPVTASDIVAVLGNPSCDLDSFISAYVLSYFNNEKTLPTPGQRRRLFVPVLNLTRVLPKELVRLRPEFAVALKWATLGCAGAPEGSSKQETNATNGDKGEEPTILDNLITVAGIEADPDFPEALRDAFKPSSKDAGSTTTSGLDTILVDHNAPAVPGINEADLKQRFDLIGGIDHHVEESIVPQGATPRIVRTGIGSCTTLVVDYLRSIGLWPDHNPDGSQVNEGTKQIARLALAPILIDTSNLTATGDKCSELDKKTVQFLQTQAGSDFDRDAFFKSVKTAKKNSLDLLTMPEIYDRDYKEWRETGMGAAKEQHLDIGISSLVQDLHWMKKHADGKKKLTESIIQYAQGSGKDLGVFMLLPKGKKGKEVVAISFSPEGKESIQRFEQSATELQLQPWNEDEELLEAIQKGLSGFKGGLVKVWWMGDTSKSRKQVAPLIREAVDSVIKQ